MSSFHLISIRAAVAAGTNATASLDTSIISGNDPTKPSTSDPIRLFLIQASIIIIFTRILAYFLSKIKQPAVIAEVIGGILLGPTVFGRIPHFREHIFPQASIPYLNLVANLGLVLFLFMVGLEIDGRIIKKCAVPALTISSAGLIIPFALGAAVSVGIYNNLIDQSRVTLGHFILFTGVAMAITALPVLARIVLDLKMIKTRVGVVVLAAGVGNDVVGWILLALAIALVNASSGLNALYIFLVVVGWILILFFAIRPAFIWLARRDGSLRNGPTQTIMTITVLLLFASAFLTDAIGVHAIFGAFLVGVIMPHEGGFAVKMTEKLEDIVSVIFLPLYFALSGLNTNLATLNSGIVWGYIVAICAIAFFSKFVSCAAAARLTGFSNRESAAVGTLMSCKGLVELIVLNLGLSAGILNTQVFSMFVVMAIVSTCATTPLTMLIYPIRFRIPFDEEIKRLKKDGDDDDAASKDGKTRGESGALMQKYLFVLDSFEHLPGLLSFVQILRPTSEAHLRPTSASEGEVRRRNNASTEKSDGESSIRHTAAASTDGGHGGSEGVPYLLNRSMQNAVRAPATVDALRIMELTERTSAVMRVAESEETIEADPLINVFRTFVRLNKLPVQAAMSVVPTDEFSTTVIERARRFGSDLVVLPWTLPAAGLLGIKTHSSSNEAGTSAAGGIFSRPVGALFGAGDSSTDHYTSHYQAAFVRRVVQTSPCHVGMLLERAGASTAKAGHAGGWGQHVVFAFMGGPDDRCALDLLVRWCKVNEEMYATVLRYRKSDDSADVERQTPQATLDHVDTVRRVQATDALYGNLSVHDTMYPNTNLNPLQAQLQDDVAMDNVQKAVKDDLDMLERFKIVEHTTPSPLAHFMAAVQGDELAAGREASTPLAASLIMLGRNRRLPTITHRDELQKLLRDRNNGTASHSLESRLIDGEMSKIIGQAAFALSATSSITVPTLVIASSLTQPAVGEEEA